MDRVRPAMLIAALVVDVGRRLPRRCGSAVPPSARLIRVYYCSASSTERPSQARFGGLTLVSRAPWLLVTGAPGLFSWPNTLWTTAVACRMSPTSRTGQAAASRRHRHRNRRGAGGGPDGIVAAPPMSPIPNGGIPASGADRFEALLRKLMPELFNEDPDLLYNLVTKI